MPILVSYLEAEVKTQQFLGQPVISCGIEGNMESSGFTSAGARVKREEMFHVTMEGGS